MSKFLMKGNDAIVRGALLAGCRLYFGYPITPASEIAEAAANYFPKIGGTFLQAESEVAAINMVYGAAGGGLRVMTASSSPGISLKQEGVSYAAGAELPCVIVDIMRGGPGLGNIAPEQSDYNQVVKGGGHGNYRCPVLAPNSVQEMGSLTMMAFDLAEKYRTPVYILADGYIGQMMEPVEFPEPLDELPRQPWAVYGDAESKHNLISSIFLDPEELEQHNRMLQEKYKVIEKSELLYEDFHLADAEYVLIGYGIVSRMLKTAVEKLRQEGIKIGIWRAV
jgi:pyruvate/2-oxoacid:ferredoxin oxidoreductase alpha subunit